MRKLSFNTWMNPDGIAIVTIALLASVALNARAAEPAAPEAAGTPLPALVDEPGNATRPLLPHRPQTSGTIKSIASKERSSVRFENRTAGKVSLYWLDQQGEKKRYGGVPARKSRTVHTFLTHAWLVTDDADQPLAVFIADAAESVAVVQPALTPLANEEERSLRSVESKTATSIRFVNQTNDLIHVFWLDYDGKRNLRGRVEPHKDLTLDTFVSHPWVVVNERDEVLGVFKPRSGESTAIVEAAEVRP
jgi:hypothetical protein